MILPSSAGRTAAHGGVMMRIRPISTRLTLVMTAIVLAAPILANLLLAHGEPPGRYCSAGICADGRNVESFKLARGPDFVVHHFRLFDGSSAGVYVGNFPERPPRNAVRTLLTVDGLGCDRVTAPEWRDRELAVYCEWSERSP